MSNIHFQEKFEDRHNGPRSVETREMLEFLGVDSLDQLIEQTVPAQIRAKQALQLPAALSEVAYLKRVKQIAEKNKVFKSYIGQGYFDVILPGVIQRNVFENPGWYTQYTPYQAEIAQGRLQALLNFQTVICDLTGLEIANASLLDEATAAAEGMFMLYSARKNKAANVFLVSENAYPQTIDVLRTRALSFGIELRIEAISEDSLTDDVFAAFVQYPAADGSIIDYKAFTAVAHAKNITVCAAADLMSLTLLTPPGEWGADVVVGNSQRFGVPMGFGGPHAAFFATKDAFKRNIPGRIIGVTTDSNGNYALRMALQTREQHIRRDKASSNICTAQALLAIMASFYAVYHGPQGIKNIASRIHDLAQLLDQAVQQLGYTQLNKNYFDTVRFELGGEVAGLKSEALNNEMNFNYVGSVVGISIDESTTYEDILTIVKVFAKVKAKNLADVDFESIEASLTSALPADLVRTSDYLTHPVFNSYHSESEMLRYIKSLEAKDLSLCHSMIPLGSCTMKLNATAEMTPVTWANFGGLHPFAPADQTSGYMQLIGELNDWLSEITGFAKMSFQPNSGAQGEYAGLMVIRAYHESRGDHNRNICLIPASAHGTNPASASMAGLKVVVVKCDDRGNIDVEDLKVKAAEHAANLNSFMVTYPSTHGVFEEPIIEICEIIHANGGQVYMDGANMNAQVGLTSPGRIGADVCHLNLHKTFCIPHGGGGPGMGPIGVAAHLVPFLPNHEVVEVSGQEGITAVSAAPFGSASILIISHAYIAMMGGDGLTNATKTAILNANYIKARLENHYPVLYSGVNGRCAHEMILDCRAYKNVGVEVADIAKRLMDYSFHAPTVSFPVAGTLMVEPTESESKAELDRFCDALIAIRQEVAAVEAGDVDQVDNVLKNAPHTASVVTADEWTRSYSRQTAAYPLAYLKDRKFWPSVGRVNDSQGDRTLICSCPSIEEYAEA
ncbi:MULTISPECIES: aminomethyl-transferring glycine dehydrogenase [Sphingobacterium]|uniref:aminomethyl-transferring glycine dehydrogenase n=1 Tax=Sphingobacterium TaxID=28453 RepID=UPI001043313A|nr:MULTISPECIES: aminomethyl-transferring glycine dehydrogenase [Sphingobacterium]MCW2261760.1 glycine dehydrogenase [Sphingobacterium kitahiroshimense]TCR10070.1 glycine dehydrogenase (decarboxylating) alpha subunit /glycine dehydrogenase (decarboxylating) beta subunit [Sphingobacterium sp. JUb78]